MLGMRQARQEVITQVLELRTAEGLQRLHACEACAPGFDDGGQGRAAEGELAVGELEATRDTELGAREVGLELASHAEVVAAFELGLAHESVEELASARRERLVREEIVDLGHRDPAAGTQR